ncbi:hypothetical protein Tco_0763692 [Tanacetum coccineum]
MEKTVAKIRERSSTTQVTSLVDEHHRPNGRNRRRIKYLHQVLHARTQRTSTSLAPQISSLGRSTFAPPVIKKFVSQTRDEVTLAKASSQPQSNYEATSTLTQFELKKILLDKIEKSESYLTAPDIG